MVYNIDSFDLFHIHRDISRVFDGMFTILVFLMIEKILNLVGLTVIFSIPKNPVKNSVQWVISD